MPAFTTTLRKFLGTAKPIHTPLPPSSSFENVFLQQWSLVDVPGNVKVTHINWPADKGLAFPAVQTFNPEAHYAMIEDEMTDFTNAFGARAAVEVPVIAAEPEDELDHWVLMKKIQLQSANKLALPVDEDEDVEVTPVSRSAIRHKPGMF